MENKKWTIADDNEQLDEMMLQIQTNQVTGLERSEGKPIVDAEEELESKIEINILGENESGPLRSAWLSLSFAFLFYYLNSFRDSGSVWLFVLLISALCSYIIYKDRRNTNTLRKVEPEDGTIRKCWYFILTKLKIEIIRANYSFRINNNQLEVRNLGYILSSIVLLLAFTVTHINSNLIPMLFGISLATTIYMICLLYTSDAADE